VKFQEVGEPVKQEIKDSLSEKDPFKDTPVKVRKVSSKMGNAMVFQKTEDDLNMTIIWVFVGGPGHG